MQNQFLARVLEAAGNTGRAIAITWLFFFFLGGLPLILAITWVAVTNPALVEAYLQDPSDLSKIPLDKLSLFVSLMLNFAIGMAGLWLSVKFVAKQRFFTILTAHHSVRWGRIMAGMGVWLLLLAAYAGVQFILSPVSFEHMPYEPNWWKWLIAAAILVPIQSAFEEMAVRGQLMQGIGKAIPDNPFVPWIMTSFVFALMHGMNSEIDAYGFMPMMLEYLFFGLFLGAFALMDEGIELPIGIHIGNNLFSMFVVSYEGSSLNTPSFFKQVTLAPTNDLLGLVLMAFLAYLVFFGRRPHLLRRLFPEPPKQSQD
jgi:membrane protease YdiL (CAAX protease family)